MTTRRTLAIILTVAALHAAFYIRYQRPDWDVAWTDQGGYHQLARGLAASGRFTRFPFATPFVPEAIRTPGYPLVVAAVIKVFGDRQTAVAVTQAVLFVMLCWLVFRIGRHVGSDRAALVAAAVVACFPPLPYFGALMMTELWTTFILSVAVLAAFRALERASIGWAIAAGACFAYTALSRPVFILLPLFLLGAWLLIRLITWSRDTIAAETRVWIALLAAFVVCVAPWFVYNYDHFGIITISPAGGLGRGIWEGSWQGRWSGGVQAGLTKIADNSLTSAELETAVRQYASEQHENADLMLTYVTQWRDIRRIWTEPTDPHERFDARIDADRTYRRIGIDNIRTNPGAYLARRVGYGQFVLWAAEIPVRYTDINRLSLRTKKTIWTPQVLLVAAAILGLIVFARRGQRIAVLLLGAPLVYVSVVHFFLLTEARQSLPVKPLLILAAVVGLSHLPSNRRFMNASISDSHERLSKPPSAI
jgi:4-amino-4-deoxy-L-arabinose transferase-like glycosyltransferase